jgi:DNA-binding CsgD family transcriptional regulator
MTVDLVTPGQARVLNAVIATGSVTAAAVALGLSARTAEQHIMNAKIRTRIGTTLHLLLQWDRRQRRKRPRGKPVTRDSLLGWVAPTNSRGPG